MKRNAPLFQPLSSMMRLFTILLCFAAGGFCLFKSGIGQSVEQPAVAASSPVSTAQAPSPTSEFKLKSVADFKVGDTIMAYNHETGEREQKIVKQTFQRQVDHLRFLEVQGEDGSRQTIKTTDEHPFWVPSAGEYLEAKQLKPGTRLTGANGHFITVKSTRYEAHPEGVTVYNVEVEDFHNYFVAANGYRGPPVLAHNTCDLSDLPEDVLYRIKKTDSKGRNFGGTSPHAPTLEDFNGRIEKVRAGDLETSIKARKHGINSDQKLSISYFTNEELIQFRRLDPISGTGSAGNISLTGGHHRVAELFERLKNGTISPDSLVDILLHD